MRVLESLDIIETLLAGVVWQMKSYAPIQTNHKHAHVISHSDTGTHSHLLEEVLRLKLAVRTVLLLVHIPDVTHVEEDGTI